MKSIVQENKECYFCGTTQCLELHHIFEGRNRQNSEKYGLKVYLCHDHHNEPRIGVHFNPIHMKLLKIIGQLYFEKTYDEDFLDIFRRNYL